MESSRKPAALAIASGILASRLAGLLRERVFAHYLGNSDAAGAFKAALKIPNLLQNLFGEGVLSASFIPVYARLLAEGREEEAGRVAGVVATLLALLLAALVAFGTLLARPLIDLIAPGFQGDVREVTIGLVEIMFSGVGLLALSAWCLGVLSSHRRFFLSYVAPVLWNLAVIAALVIFGGRLVSTRWGQMQLVHRVAWATVVGAALQLGFQLPVALRLARGVRPSLAANSPLVRRVIHNFVPVVVSRGVVQLSAYIDQVLASYLGAQVVAAMAYAQNLYLLPISLFGMAISAAELPEMSSALGTPEQVGATVRARLLTGFGRIAFLVVPSLIAFLLLGDVAVAALYQTGKFGAGDTRAVWMILAGSTVGLLAATQARLCASAFYAVGDTRTPLRFAILRVVLTAALGVAVTFPLRRTFGWPAIYAASGLTASAGVAGWVEFLLLRRSLARRIGAFNPEASLILRIWAAGLAAGLAALALHRALAPGHPVLQGLLVLGLYGALYLGVGYLAGLPQARDAITSLKRLFRART